MPSFLSLPIEPSGGAGPAVALPASRDTKTFGVFGDFEGVVALEASTDGSNWAKVAQVDGPDRQTKNTAFAANFVRSFLAGIAQPSLPIPYLGYDAVTNGPVTSGTIAVPVSIGAGAGLDVSAYTRLKSIVVTGGSQSQCAMILEGSADGGVNYVPLAALNFDGAVLNILGYFSHIRARLLRGSSSGIAIRVASEPNAGGSLNTPTQLIFFGGRVRQLVTTSDYPFIPPNARTDAGDFALTGLSLDYPMSACTVGPMRLNVTVAPTASCTVTLLKNGIASAISVTFSSTGTFTSAATVAFAAGDTLDLQLVGGSAADTTSLSAALVVVQA
jgi:hypothetical protein